MKTLLSNVTIMQEKLYKEHASRKRTFEEALESCTDTFEGCLKRMKYILKTLSADSTAPAESNIKTIDRMAKAYVESLKEK